MRFVIIASPRTGSSHLTDLLNHQEDILCNGEIFHKKRPFVRWPESEMQGKAKKALAELREDDPFAFTERVFASGFGRSHVGFKIVNNRNNAVLFTLLRDRSVFKIVLHRRNVLANYSSKRIAAATGKWSHKEGKPNVAPPKIRFDPLEFREFYNEYTVFYRDVLNELNATAQPFRLLNYEEINDPILFAGLVGSIGGDASSVRFDSGHVKQNSSDIVSRFSNPEEVRLFLTSRGLMHWAFEGGTSLEMMSDEPGETSVGKDLPH